jgi:hypothetical protein
MKHSKVQQLSVRIYLADHGQGRRCNSNTFYAANSPPSLKEKMTPYTFLT